ncbi:phosphatase PAP2 family protein [Streptomyces sp. NPDC001228]|uniref:phosphatase PAP2 family protein n=1 Tax=Streptomyces sp. NPDC001228 TaxID=3154381 RepID=UPI00332CFEB7
MTLFLAAVYLLAVWTPAGQRMENDLFKRPAVSAVTEVPDRHASPSVPPADVAYPPAPPTVVILGTTQSAVLGGLLLLVPLARRRARLAAHGLVLMSGSAATALVLKEVLPRPLLDPAYAVGLGAQNSTPSGHVTMATSLVLVALVVCPARLRYAAASVGVVVAVLTGYFVQCAGWHRPSDVLMGAALSLLWAFLASVLIPLAEEDVPGTRTNAAVVSLCVVLASAAALVWALQEETSPAFPALVAISAAAPCAAAVVLGHHRFRRRSEAEGRPAVEDRPAIVKAVEGTRP